ncbi:MAG: hypothetical protein HC805_07060, partial [Alkalinema sp. RL_2_19]|nr:hypothetical protein [Alkalinema sp. RL_2_19]
MAIISSKTPPNPEEKPAPVEAQVSLPLANGAQQNPPPPKQTAADAPELLQADRQPEENAKQE